MNTNLTNNNSILIVGSKEKSSLDDIYFRTFQNLGYKIEFFNIEKSLNHRIIAGIKKYFSSMNNQILRRKLFFFLKKKKTKFSVIIFFKCIFLDKEILKKIKLLNENTKYINIFPDDPFDIKNPVISNKSFLNAISEFDLFCIWSKKIQNKLKKKFCNKIIYLPFAFDSLKIKIHKNNKLKRKNEIFFLGTYDQKRYEILNSIKYKKKIFGGNWLRIEKKKINNSVIGKHIYGKKISKLSNNSAISLNILRKQNLTSHNMKTFEIPSQNGLMLTTRSKEQNNFFTENKSCFMYSSIKELNKKIDYIFKNPKKAEKIRRSGSKVVKRHSYINRVKYLMNEMKKII